MNQDTFDTEWDLWSGLFQAGRRSKGAYFSQLRHLTDREFKNASRSAIQSHTSRTFPTVGEILSHVHRVTGFFAPTYPIAGASKDDLRRSYERLEGFYELAQLNADMAGEPSPNEAATHVKKVVHRALQKLIAINAESIKVEFHRKPEENPKIDCDRSPRRNDLE